MNGTHLQQEAYGLTFDFFSQSGCKERHGFLPTFTHNDIHGLKNEVAQRHELDPTKQHS